MTKKTAAVILTQIYNTWSTKISENYKDGVVQEAFELAIEVLSGSSDEKGTAMSKDITIMPPDFITHYVKTDRVQYRDPDGNVAYEIAAERTVLVRCKECRLRGSRPFCQGRYPDFFCADGVR